MKATLDDKLKYQFSNQFSLLYKNWEKKPYYVFAEAASKKKLYAHLPVDMLFFALDNYNEIKLENDIFEFLNYDGCKEYENYIIENIPNLMTRIQQINLQERHFSSLCRYIYKCFLDKTKFHSCIELGTLLVEINRNKTLRYLEQDLKWILRKATNEDSELSIEEKEQLISFAERLNIRSKDFKVALDIAKTRYLTTCANDTLTVILKKIFPNVEKDIFNIYEYTEGCLIHYFKWNKTSIGEYVNDNYEKALTNIIRAIDKDKVTEDEAKYAKHLLIALAMVYCERKSSVTQDKLSVVYRLNYSEETFREVVKSYAPYIAELVVELFFIAFKNLEKAIMEDLFLKCISQYSKGDDGYSYFTGSFSFKFINCFTGLPLWSEDNSEKYFELCEYIDNIIPELKFKTHQAYNFFELAKEGARGLKLLQPLLEKMEQNVCWVESDDLPQYLEFDYIYPNGKNGDIIKYIFEEYGETSMKSGLAWHGKISKEYKYLFEIFYSSIPLAISEDTQYQKIFKYHIPTIIADRLNELTFKKANYFGSFREYQNKTVAYSKEQTKKRGELYSQLILQGQTSPKWKSEAQLFSLVSTIYPDAKYQYRAEWLYMQSLDIFIPSLSIGIEYQGVQHYKAIDYFGGEEHFRHQQENDQKKRNLCKKNGVLLIEWPYSVEISEDNLKHFLHQYQS